MEKKKTLTIKELIMRNKKKRELERKKSQKRTALFRKKLDEY